MNTFQAVTMNENDNVAVAIKDISKNSAIEINHQIKTIRVLVVDDIEFGHKFSILPIKKGENILKYGEVIGVATIDIGVGEHVHIHNLEGIRGRGDRVEQSR